MTILLPQDSRNLGQPITKIYLRLTRPMDYLLALFLQLPNRILNGRIRVLPKPLGVIFLWGRWNMDYISLPILTWP
jgi:hypothetical protein